MTAPYIIRTRPPRSSYTTMPDSTLEKTFNKFGK
jgi:hypothetical protein